jgi:ABC-type uncharacterized transport system substrate-binding protein
MKSRRFMPSPKSGNRIVAAATAIGRGLEIDVALDRRVIELSNRYRMPGIFDAREFVDAGAFMSYGPNLEAIFRRLAGYADQILKGVRPGELPIEQPTEFELALNLKTAKAMGIQVPDSIMVSANQLVE